MCVYIYIYTFLACSTLVHDGTSITIGSLVTKGLNIQKISPEQTFSEVLNRCCVTDLENRNPIFSGDIRAYVMMMCYQSLVAERLENRNSPVVIMCALSVCPLPNDALIYDNASPH